MFVLLACVFALPARATLFRLPLDKPEEIWVEWVIHVDHDPADGGLLGADCLAFNGSRGFPSCYDAHDGTDYLLSDNWDAMDEERVTVLAAADGWVTSVADGNYDRCHSDFASKSVSCDGYPMVGNHVKISHMDGMESWYWHFKKDTIIVEKGDFVRCGDPLGFVGSSGNSTGPHLHFEVRKNGDWIDPYAGPISQPESYWVQQDGPLDLPGPYCEGDEIPPDPKPEPDIKGEDTAATAEALPDVSEDVSPDDGAVDAWLEDAAWGEDVSVGEDDGVPTDRGPGGDGNALDAPGSGDDSFGGRFGGWGCAATSGVPATGVSAALMLLALAVLWARRRPCKRSYPRSECPWNPLERTR